VTVLLIQNTTSDPVTGTVFFFGTGGGAAVPLSVEAYGLQVINTGTIPALAGLSGNLQIAHLGGWGALNVKAVALEPSTGFTFDTVGAQRPR
jgi:hypothetical protein